MRQKARVFGAVLITAVTLGLAAGCAGPSGPKAAENSKEAIEFAQTLPSGQERYDYLKKQVRQFLDQDKVTDALLVAKAMFDMPESYADEKEFKAMMAEVLARSITTE